MAKLIVIKSGSSGNSYALQTDTGTLLLEAGVGLNVIRRHVNPADCIACIVSHRHGDHAKYAKNIASRIPLAAHPDVLEYKDIKHNGIVLQNEHTTALGQFSVSPFLVPHSNSDGSPCPNFGFVIHHPEFGEALFLTDTFNCPVRIPYVRHFIIEANYSDELLNDAVARGATAPSQRRRVHLSHMSIDACINTIHQCGYSKAKSITLIHISQRHADPELFKERCQYNFGIPVYIAKPGEEIPLIKDDVI